MTRAGVGCVLTVCLLLAGCRQAPPTEPESISSLAERGPLKFVVEITPSKVWVGDRITIDLRVHTPEGRVVRFPGEDAFGDLTILDIETADPRPGAAGGLDWRQTVRAESLVSGVVDVPPLVIKYGKQPEDAEAEPDLDSELVSDALRIEVRSALTSQDSVLSPRDITGVLTPPPPPHGPWFVGMVAGAVAGVIAGIIAVARWLRRRAKRLPPPIPPEVWALRELAALEAAGLVEDGRARVFYYSLSEIVRVYIERKFHLAAPEMTTEEFLNTLARDRGALPYDADRLRDFLTACDLVKYAAFSPRVEDARRALGVARGFIDATAAAVERVAESSGGQAA